MLNSYWFVSDWSPLDLNPVLWLDAVDGVVQVANAVSQLTDLSGNGNHFIENTPSAQPQWNGVDDIHFDGIGEKLVLADISDFVTLSGGDVYIVGQAVSTAFSYGLNFNKDGSNYFQCRVEELGGLYPSIAAPSANAYDSTGSFVRTQRYVLRFTQDQVLFKIYVDGVNQTPLVVNALGTKWIATWPTMVDASLCASFFGGWIYSNTKLSSVVVTDSVLSVGDDALLTAYLTDKFL